MRGADEHARRRRDSPSDGDRACHAERRTGAPGAIGPRGARAGDLARYNLGDATNSRIQYGRVAGISGHMKVLRYAAGVCKDAFEPGTTERGLLEQFADDDLT